LGAFFVVIPALILTDMRGRNGRKIMMQRYIVKAAACLEIVVGVIFIIAPNIPCALLWLCWGFLSLTQG